MHGTITGAAHPIRPVITEDQKLRAASVVYNQARRELELALDIDPIEELLALRLEMIREYAPLEERFGVDGSWEADRKADRSKIVAKLRDEDEKRFQQEMKDALEQAKGASDSKMREAILKMPRPRASETELDSRASASDEYAAQLKAVRGQRARMNELKAEIAAIDAIIFRDNLLGKKSITELYHSQGAGV